MVLLSARRSVSLVGIKIKEVFGTAFHSAILVVSISYVMGPLPLALVVPGMGILMIEGFEEFCWNRVGVIGWSAGKCPRFNSSGVYAFEISLEFGPGSVTLE